MSRKKSYCQNTSLAKREASDPAAGEGSSLLMGVREPSRCPEGVRARRRHWFSPGSGTFEWSVSVWGYGGGYVRVLPCVFDSSFVLAWL